MRPSEIAVLYRINAQSEVYEQALADAGVPYQLRGAERFFERPEVREAGMLLRGAARAGGTSDPLLDEADLPAQVRAVLGSRGWSPQPPAGSGAVAGPLGVAGRAGAAGGGLRRGVRPGATLADLVAELDERAAAQHAPTVEGVTLASLHAAKGLEWDAVFLVGLSEGMMPITYAKTDEQVEEERRLLYVGVTRAREHLALSWALSRSPGGRGGRRPSRFLTGLRTGTASRGGFGAPGGAGAAGSVERGGADRGAAARRRRGPVHCRVCGRALSEAGEIKLMRCEDCPSELDEGLYERLREWRAGQAALLGQPAYCVFTDKTLLAIAETTPDTEAALSRIAGVGARKLRRFGSDVLALCSGAEPGPAEGDSAGIPDSVDTGAEEVSDSSIK